MSKQRARGERELSDQLDSMPTSGSDSEDEGRTAPAPRRSVAPLVAVGHPRQPAIVDSSRRSRPQQPPATTVDQESLPSSGRSALNLGPMASSLPDQPVSPSYQVPQQQIPPGSAGSRFTYQLPQSGGPFDPRSAGMQQGATSWNQPHGQQYPQHYPRHNQPAVGSPGAHPGPQNYFPQHPSAQGATSPVPFGYPEQSWVPQPQPGQQTGPYYYPTAGYPPGAQQFPGRPVGNYTAQFPRRPSFPQSQAQFSQQEFSGDRGPQSAAGARYGPAGYGARGGPSAVDPLSIPGAGRGGSGESPTSLHPSMPRGPPRKPKQSGHALWVGNLPPGTLVTDLKDHFAKEATNDIESVFLISKSNCAFVNYKTEATCAAAMSRFHDSRFHGVRLVCRLRRNSATPSPGRPASATSAGGAAAGDLSPTADATPDADVLDEATDPESDTPPGQGAGQTPGVPPASSKDKYFVVKSLTLEDLELSVKNGIWATQAHNEAALNKAYESAEVVYLIFSANKSGEYFGYARMASRIDEESSSTIEWAPRSIPAEDFDLPKAIPTPATATAPRGKIIDDSARGTIFWEAEAVEDPEADKEGEDVSSGEEEGKDAPLVNKTWGKPFKIEWISTNRLPFYRTRGLRNPWNANREVKIARDGTELETSVGRKLVQMFSRASGAPGGGGGGYGAAASAGQSQYGASPSHMQGPY